MEYREARPSTESEDAPLLRDPDARSSSANGGRTRKKTFSEHVDAITREPLTTLAKLLLIVALFLLLLASVFIGLFAGAEHKLRHRADGPRPTGTLSRTVTLTGTTTSLSTSTVVSLSVTTTTVAATTTAASSTTVSVTTTEVRTTTIPAIPAPAPTGGPDADLCVSSECIILSANILQGLDETQDPCENFYEFANGGWLSTHEIPPGKGRYGSFDRLSEENKRIIRRILNPPTPTVSSSLDAADEETLRKLRDLYTSCANEDYLNELGLQPLLSEVNEIRSLFRTDAWGEAIVEGQKLFNPLRMGRPSKHGLTAAIAYMHSRGLGGLFNFDIDGDVGDDPNFMTLWFYQPDLGLPSKEYYKEKDIIEVYENTLSEIFAALDDKDDVEEGTGSILVQDTDEKVTVWPPWPWPPWGDDDNDDKDKPNKTERARILAKKVIKFETRIADASLDLDVLLQDPYATYNPVKFTELAKQLPQISFPMYFSTFTPRNFPSRVILTSTTYAESLSGILKTSEAEVIEAYLVSHAALELAPYLGSETSVWRAQRSLTELLQGIPRGQVPDRADWCAQRVESALGFAAGRFFVNETFGGDSKAKGTKVITDIIGSFKESLKNLTWMDEESAQAAAGKADAINVKVGYPLSPNTLSSTSIEAYYRLVIVDKNEFMRSLISAQISDEYKKWQMLGKQRDREAWLMPPSMVNAYFNPPANEIVFPAGILRPPFFSKNWPAYLQYGAFGMVAAHELTHAFDSAGRLYNQEGKLEPWWTNATSEGFDKIQKCIADQYSSYTIDDGKGGKVHVNGNLTSGENIGDSGLVQAFRAWHGQFHTSLMNGQEYLLPGLNYTQEQLFFIGFGQIWGELIKPAAALQRIRTDPHSPNKYRVEGTLTNTPEFARVFNCKAGSKLNPPMEERCILW